MDGAFDYGLFTVIWNMKQPVITTKAQIVNKREDHNDNFTYYYVTFACSDSSHVEFSLAEEEFKLLRVGDTGLLSVQGTSYQGFIRRSGY